jgi:hypothetical protein
MRARFSSLRGDLGCGAPARSSGPHEVFIYERHIVETGQPGYASYLTDYACRAASSPSLSWARSVEALNTAERAPWCSIPGRQRRGYSCYMVERRGDLGGFLKSSYAAAEAQPDLQSRASLCRTQLSSSLANTRLGRSDAPCG